MLQRKDCAKCGVNQADKPLIALPMIFLCDDCYSKQESLEKRIKDLKALRDTVSISCNPPEDCNDPKVLKTYMKGCFDEASKLY